MPIKLESYPFKLYSRQIEENNYELLYSHLKEVGETSKKIVMEKKIQDQTTLSEVAYLVGIAHDFGKGTTFFQLYLTKHVKTEKTWHGPISSIFGYYLVKEYLKIKGKPKSLTLKGRLPFYVWLAILRHHGDIKDVLGTEGELERLKKLGEILSCQVED
ncbi:MAG: CRISPR-associated endonuclease Cas3'', partial [Candidatus Bathyarchaeia archaeon]